MPMERKRSRRTARLVIALTSAILLSFALVYTSFSASSETVTPAQLLQRAVPGETYELTGRVVEGSWEREGTVHRFEVENRTGGGTPVAVEYAGSVPDPFREGREIIVDVRREGAGFVGQKNSLVTKCPSKFGEEKPGGAGSMS